MTPHLKITFVIFSLGAGGAERVLTQLANYWAKAGQLVSVVTLSAQQPFYPLDRNIKWIPLKLAKPSRHIVAGLFNNVERIQILRKFLKANQPDIIISFMNSVNILTLLACANLKIPVIVSDRIDLEKYSPGRFWAPLMYLTYPRAKSLVIQYGGYIKNYPESLRGKIRVIPNPVHIPTPETGQRDQRFNHPTVISMGRLENQKGMDVLIRAFAQIHTRYDDWRLAIIGGGALKSELESLCKEVKVKNHVWFAGIVKSPDDLLAQAKIFALASRFEGFPNALCEAMACGLPVIATDCSPAIREIIREGEDGLIVPTESPEKLAFALETLIRDAEKRHQMGAKAREITDRFGFEKVMQMWEDVIEAAI